MTHVTILYVVQSIPTIMVDSRRRWIERRPMWRISAILASALALGSCGPPLGTYSVARVTLVASTTLTDIEPTYDMRDHPRLLRIELASSINLEMLKDVSSGNVYVLADLCPYRDGGIMLIGPYYGDRSRFAPARYPGDAAPAEKREPPYDQSLQAYVYTAYLKPYQKPNRASRPSEIEIKGYDLRTDTRDLCLRLSQTGYFLTPSQSTVIKLPRASVARALGLPK